MLNMCGIVCLEACQSPSQSEHLVYTDPSTTHSFAHSYTPYIIRICNRYNISHLFWFVSNGNDEMCVSLDFQYGITYIIIFISNKSMSDGWISSFITIVIISMYTHRTRHASHLYLLCLFFLMPNPFLFLFAVRFVVIFVYSLNNVDQMKESDGWGGRRADRASNWKEIGKESFSY